MNKCWERQEDLNLVLTLFGLLPGYSSILILSVRVSTNVIFLVCEALVLVNSCHCIILKVVLRGYWDPISCCALICTLSTFILFFFPSDLVLFQRKNWQERWTKLLVVFLFCFNIGSGFTYKYLNYFCTTDKGKMTSTVVSKHNTPLWFLWFFFF